MIFLDTSGVIALADKEDVFHGEALRMFDTVQEVGESILVHSYLVVESAALLQRRLGLDSSVRFLRESRRFNIQWIEPEVHYQAVEYQVNSGAAKLSFVDAVSFLVMRSRNITDFIGFDKHFIEAGFTQYGSKEL